MGCDSSGFFSLFNGQSAQCGPVNNQIQQMRANLEQITTSLERLRSGGIGGADRENQRRSVLTALAQNNCGPQYAAAARGPGNFLDNLFGEQQQSAAAAQRRSRRAFRHLSHRLRPHLRRRLFPGLVRHRASRVSRTTRGPARRCARRRRRPCSPTAIPAKTSTRRSRSAASPIPRCPNAFQFRTEFNPSCACKAAGQTWSEALKSVDDKAAVEQQGDIIVTEESAKRMQQRAQPKGQTLPPTAKKGAAPAGPTAATPPPAHRLPPIQPARPTKRSRSAPSARPSSRRSSSAGHRAPPPTAGRDPGLALRRYG